MNLLKETPSYISKLVEMSRLFFLEGSSDEGFGVHCGGFERCRPDYRVNRPGLPWFCLEFVSRGVGQLELNGANHDLRPGTFFIYGPGMAHRIESSEADPLGKYFVGFMGSEVQGFMDQYDLSPGMVAHCHKADSVRRGFDMLIDRGVRKSGLANPLCSLIAKELLLLCRDDSSGLVDLDSPAYVTFTRAKECIENRYMTLTSLDAVSKSCEVEAAYLCRLFARYHDESPYQFLTRLRMDHASRLLLTDEASVRSVADEMGYKDPFHFSRVFKSVHRVPPSRFKHSMYA